MPVVLKDIVGKRSESRHFRPTQTPFSFDALSPANPREYMTYMTGLSADDGL